MDSSAARGSATAVALSRSSSQRHIHPPVVYDGQPVIDITQMLELVEEEGDQDWSTRDWGWDPMTASCAAVHVPRQDPIQVLMFLLSEMCGR